MRTKEQIHTSVELPPEPSKRIGAAEKARQLINQEGDEFSPLYAKITTRILPDQMEWLKSEVKSFRRRNPRVPKLTIEELTRIALDHLREAKNLGSLISKHRS